MTAISATAPAFAIPDSLIASLRSILPPQALLTTSEDLKPYECDGLSAYRALPMLAVLPQSVAEVQKILRAAHASSTKVVARGSGTGLSGGATPLSDGMLMSLAKFNRIVSIDALARTARVQPGVRNLQISEVSFAGVPDAMVNSIRAAYPIQGYMDDFVSQHGITSCTIENGRVILETTGPR